MNPAENYMLTKPEPFRSILIELRAIIKQTVPEVKETFKWSLPFYMLDGKMYCYLNFRKTFVDLGFHNAVMLKDFQHHLIAGEGRKVIRSLRYTSLEEIDHDVLTDILLAQQQNVRPS